MPPMRAKKAPNIEKIELKGPHMMKNVAIRPPHGEKWSRKTLTW